MTAAAASMVVSAASEAKNPTPATDKTPAANGIAAQWIAQPTETSAPARSSDINRSMIIRPS
jgi:hypothetical protein